MVRKLISITLCALMLLCIGVPALAATNNTAPTETQTVEDILNEYHEKSFALETTQSGTGPAARSSRSSSSGKSLEEETVEELTAAGYEAYHVTSSNYEELETSLLKYGTQPSVLPMRFLKRVASVICITKTHIAQIGITESITAAEQILPIITVMFIGRILLSTII